MNTVVLTIALGVVWATYRHASLTDRIYQTQMTVMGLGGTVVTKLGRWLIYREARREATRLLWPIRPKAVADEKAIR